MLRSGAGSAATTWMSTPEPVGVEPDRLLDALDPVDRVERRMGVEHDLAAAVDRVAAAGEQLVDVGLLDLVAAQARPRHWRRR